MSFASVLLLAVVVFATGQAYRFPPVSRPYVVPEENNTQINLRNQCVDNWGYCLSEIAGHTPPSHRYSCQNCHRTCSAALKADPVCILLNNYCEDAAHGKELYGCRDPNCVWYWDRCDVFNLDSDDCKYCASECGTQSSCKTQYSHCSGHGSGPVTTGCSDKVCDYYYQLCIDSSSPTVVDTGNFFCDKCIIGCSNLANGDCKSQEDECRKRYGAV